MIRHSSCSGRFGSSGSSVQSSTFDQKTDCSYALRASNDVCEMRQTTQASLDPVSLMSSDFQARLNVRMDVPFFVAAPQTARQRADYRCRDRALSKTPPERMLWAYPALSAGDGWIMGGVNEEQDDSARPKQGSVWQTAKSLGMRGGAGAVVAAMSAAGVLVCAFSATPAAGTTAKTVQTIAGSYGEGVATEVPGAFGRMAVHNKILYTLPEPITNIYTDPAAAFGYVKAIDLSTGRERVIAGTGDGGDHGPALTARLIPMSIAVAPDGTIYVGEPTDVRKIDKSGMITTVAHIRGLGVAADAAGGVFVVDGQSAYEISPNGATRTLVTIQGSPNQLSQIVV